MQNIELLDPKSANEDLVVLAFDMCSSSKLIEDLTRTQNLNEFNKLLKSLHRWLATNAKKLNYIVYKFTGDGWIILFPSAKTNGSNLLDFLVRLSKQHKSLYNKLIDSHLESAPTSTGLTFGLEMGTLTKVVLDKELEFVGRAINVACRLQSAVKDKEQAADYHCLFSRKVFNSYLKGIKTFEFQNVERSLRNISDGERYRCVKTNLAQHF